MAGTTVIYKRDSLQGSSYITSRNTAYMTKEWPRAMLARQLVPILVQRTYYHDAPIHLIQDY